MIGAEAGNDFFDALDMLALELLADGSFAPSRLCAPAWFQRICPELGDFRVSSERLSDEMPLPGKFSNRLRNVLEIGGTAISFRHLGSG